MVHGLLGAAGPASGQPEVFLRGRLGDRIAGRGYAVPERLELPPRGSVRQVPWLGFTVPSE